MTVEKRKGNLPAPLKLRQTPKGRGRQGGLPGRMPGSTRGLYTAFWGASTPIRIDPWGDENGHEVSTNFSGVIVHCLYTYTCSRMVVVGSHTRSATCPCSTSTVPLLTSHTLGTMDSQEYLPRVPRDIKFRILVIGRANAGMTSILQRLCDTTGSPEIYRLGRRGKKRERVRPRS